VPDSSPESRTVDDRCPYATAALAEETVAAPFPHGSRLRGCSSAEETRYRQGNPPARIRWLSRQFDGRCPYATAALR